MDDSDPDVPTVFVTQGAAAWQDTIARLSEVWRKPVQARFDAAVPDDHGRITLELGEWMAMEVVAAQDDALTDHLEEDQVL